MQKTSKRTASNRTRFWKMILTLLSATILWMEGYGAILHAAQLTVEPRRSLVVTEAAILARFPFVRVMDQLVDQSGVAGLTSLLATPEHPGGRRKRRGRGQVFDHRCLERWGYELVGHEPAAARRPGP